MTALIISNRDRTSGALTLLASKSSGVAYWQFSHWHYSRFFHWLDLWCSDFFWE